MKSLMAKFTCDSFGCGSSVSFEVPEKHETDWLDNKMKEYGWACFHPQPGETKVFCQIHKEVSIKTQNFTNVNR